MASYLQEKQAVLPDLVPFYVVMNVSVLHNVNVMFSHRRRWESFKMTSLNPWRLLSKPQKTTL